MKRGGAIFTIAVNVATEYHRVRASWPGGATTSGGTVELGGVGVWSTALRYGAKDEVADAAAELESLGYSALWFPDTGGDVFGAAATLLEATRSVVVATGILNLWMHDPVETAGGFARLSGAHPGRFLLGIGASHAPIVDRAEPGRYRQPLAAMAAYLDALDRADPPVPAEARVLAASVRRC
jgi:probable F420-dependent oxidoreductase